MRVLVLDRGVVNPYSLGLVGGLRQLGVDACVGGPANADDPDVRMVYPRYCIQGQRFQKAIDLPFGGARLVALLSRWQPDIVHLQWAGTIDLAYARIAKRYQQTRLAFTIHNPLARANARRQMALAAIADVVFVHGETLRDALAEVDPLSAKRAIVASHGSYSHAVTRYGRRRARERLGLPRDHAVYAFLGSIGPRKGVDILLDAFKMVHELHEKTTLVIAGHAVDQAGRRAVEMAAVSQRGVMAITQRSHLPAETLDLVASAADQIVLPFREASQSGSVIYGMTHGRCVVSTDRGEIPTVLTGRGLVVPAGSRTALVKSMMSAVEDRSLCEQLAAEARRFAVGELEWSRAAGSFFRGYESVLGQRQR